jgi:hypothetical protein
MRKPHRTAAAFFASLALLSLPFALFGQGSPAPAPAPANPEHGTMHLQTKVGSFKLLSPGERMAEGRMEISFTGTVLISGLQGTATPSGATRLEYRNQERQRDLYFVPAGSTGSLVIDGKYRAIQFFGRDMRATHRGMGIYRLFGEFDRDLNTGEFWYDESPERQIWHTGGFTTTNPPARRQAPQPRFRDQ